MSRLGACSTRVGTLFASSGAGESDADPAELAYALLSEMSERGVVPNDRCQNALVRVVSEAGRIDDMLDEVKAIARRRGKFERDDAGGGWCLCCLPGSRTRSARFESCRGWTSAGTRPAPRRTGPSSRCAPRRARCSGRGRFTSGCARLGYRPDRPTWLRADAGAVPSGGGDGTRARRGARLRRAIEAGARSARRSRSRRGGRGRDHRLGRGRRADEPDGHDCFDQEIAPMEDQSNWDAVGDWSLENDAPVALDPRARSRARPPPPRRPRPRRVRFPPRRFCRRAPFRSPTAAAARTGEPGTPRSSCIGRRGPRRSEARAREGRVRQRRGRRRATRGVRGDVRGVLPRGPRRRRAGGFRRRRRRTTLG